MREPSLKATQWHTTHIVAMPSQLFHLENFQQVNLNFCHYRWAIRWFHEQVDQQIWRSAIVRPEVIFCAPETPRSLLIIEQTQNHFETAA